MGWRPGEVWLESELSWFRERAREAALLPSLAAPAFAGLGEPTVFGPVANGLAESRRRRDELRRRRSARRTRTAALVLGPAVALSVATPKVVGAARSSGVLADDPPSLSVRLGGSAAQPPPHVRGAARPTALPPPRPGSRTQEEVAPAIRWRRATSHGLPYAGWLSGGTQLPLEGPDWVTWNPVEDHRPNRPGRLFGNERTIRAILSVVAAHRAAHPGAPRVLVGDLSLRDGGPIDEHRSHQNGLDVDVYYPRVDRAQRTPVSPAQVDRHLAQDLVDRFLAAGAQTIFVGFATGLEGPSGVVVPYPSHEDHMHVRFAPPAR
jgi:hypothetical protein